MTMKIDISGALANGTGFTKTGKETAVGWGVPDYTAGVSITNGYVAPCSGIITTSVLGNIGGWVQINGKNVNYITGHSGSSHGQPTPSVTLIVMKGDTFICPWAYAPLFFPFKGVE